MAFVRRKASALDMILLYIWMSVISTYIFCKATSIQLDIAQSSPARRPVEIPRLMRSLFYREQQLRTSGHDVEKCDLMEMSGDTLQLLKTKLSPWRKLNKHTYQQDFTSEHYDIHQGSLSVGLSFPSIRIPTLVHIKIEGNMLNTQRREWLSNRRTDVFVPLNADLTEDKTYTSDFNGNSTGYRTDNSSKESTRDLDRDRPWSTRDLDRDRPWSTATIQFQKSLGSHHFHMLPELTMLYLTRSQLNCSQSRSKRDISEFPGMRRSVICQKRPLYLDFKAIGWDSHVFVPKGLQIFECEGLCPFPLTEQLNGTNAAVIQSLAHALDPDKVPGSSCVPSAYSSVSLLMLFQGRPTMKVYKEMVVTDCSCH